MDRKNFLLTGLGSFTLISTAKTGYAAPLTPIPFKIAAGKGRFNESFLYKGKNPNDIKISKTDTHNQLAVFEYTGFEKTGPSLHVHFHQDEIFYVIEGRYRFVVGNEEMMASTGDTIFLPKNIPHTWIQLTELGKLLYFVQPAGQAESFFRTMSTLNHQPTFAEVQEIHLKHGMKVIGPPLTL